MPTKIVCRMSSHLCTTRRPLGSNALLWHPLLARTPTTTHSGKGKGVPAEATATKVDLGGFGAASTATSTLRPFKILRQAHDGHGCRQPQDSNNTGTAPTMLPLRLLSPASSTFHRRHGLVISNSSIRTGSEK